MPRKKLERQALIACQLLIEMVRTSARVFNDGENISQNYSDLLLTCAIYLGEAEGKPMSAGKLAIFIGMPRPTVLRRLADLEARSHTYKDARGSWRIPANEMLWKKITVAVRQNVACIQRASLALSKMDT